MSPRISFSAAALLCLSACASPTELRGGKAVIDVMIDKPAERVAGCISDEFEKANTGLAAALAGFKFSTRPTSEGFSISGIQSGGLGSDTVILVDVTKTDSRTHVMMFDHFLGGGGKWIALVRSCL